MKKHSLIAIVLCVGSTMLAACDAKKDETPSDSVSSIEKTDYKIGSIIEFGKFEQDGDLTNGAEPIKWKIKEKTDETITVLSEYGLDVIKFHEEFTGVSWEGSNIRSWLNSDFYSNAFSDADKASIVKTTRDNKAGSDKYRKDGNPTEDNVWILSFDEANAYFYDNSTKRYNLSCKPTARAIANGAYVNEDGNTKWWLSTSANDGSVDQASPNFITKGGVTLSDVCFRPSITIAYKTL